ncbi:MAG: ester cyclase [Chloroflexi bacterium]|nr:ester cyclase [Chloroflexota bacterium]MBK7176083.1 ester cyclase [Chloroflexota bacterium]MBK7917845.1 ester cyclase [Chloroflexota bacterium]MBK8935405.1 ester cyclase [Chloroflexota bacterium]MBP6805969.1 ester cyclase [Chloroflexota bacterium]
MTFVETNKAVVRRFYAEAWNQKKLEILEETHAPDWTHIDPSNPADLSGGPEANRARLSQLIAAFPDIHYTLEDVIAEGDKVVVRFTVTGTHQGAFAGIPATGRQVAMQGIIIHRLQDGKIIEDWVVRDTLGLMQQLGVIPSPQN